MIFDLTDADREALERVRVKLGARSHADVLRKLIRAGDEAPTVTMSIGLGAPPDRAAPAALSAQVEATLPAEPAPPTGSAILVRERERIARPIKSRLKGEWKAP